MTDRAVDDVMVEERRRLLVDQVRREGRIKAADAALTYGVSEDSIRRDLRVLAAEGLLQRVRGGALPAAPAEPFGDRLRRSTPELLPLAAAVADRLAEAGGVIVLDAGVTNLRIAEALPSDADLTVVTSAPAVGAAALAAGIELVMLGGVVDRDIGAAVDANAVDGLRSIRADVAVLGICAVDPTSGVTTARADEVAFKRSLIAGAAEVVVVAGAEKVGTVAPYAVAEAGKITTLMTEPAADPVARQAFIDLGIDVRVV